MVDIYIMGATPHPILLLSAASCVPLACTHGLVISLKVCINLYSSLYKPEPLRRPCPRLNDCCSSSYAHERISAVTNRLLSNKLDFLCGCLDARGIQGPVASSVRRILFFLIQVV
ncbi:hypothetical protein BO79DRAFT_14113 [Aspergillus costaricaensis CBS 115574]|uniref:Uncharacterized protein n=1 Tax=Aspergillus costaricaensis CBS 115574 TaxID=1448317 RepID=A0ACD1IE00_9EURO|nr:hypothetical protein BO79DRAFT_14113 [Aspergillus costaricaensis CBS 115574]RAK88800.1 hypothetical protein BO79DRAFT_14113 [Aspergillus costaricaensis CBS 115574]